MPPRVIVGSLLLQLQTAAERLADVEQRVRDHIAELLPGWDGTWGWSAPAAIEVYGADHAPHDLANATLSLRFAGFADIRIHDHDQGKRLLSCACRWRTT